MRREKSGNKSVEISVWSGGRMTFQVKKRRAKMNKRQFNILFMQYEYEHKRNNHLFDYNKFKE